MLHRSRWNLAGPLLPAKFHLDRFGGGVYGPQNWKNLNFANIIAPKGRVPCTIFTKFTGFMRILSLHNFAKFRCFISINGKIISNYIGGSVFSHILTPPSGETMDRTQKRFRPKNDGTDQLYHHAKFGGNRATHVGVRGRNVMFIYLFLFFVYNAPDVTDDLVALLQQEIAFVFIGRFRCGLQRFFGEEKPFPVNETDLEISARRRYHTCRNARENCQSPRKWVQSLCAPLRPFKSEMKENFYRSILRHYCRCAPV